MLEVVLMNLLIRVRSQVSGHDGCELFARVRPTATQLEMLGWKGWQKERTLRCRE